MVAKYVELKSTFKRCVGQNMELESSLTNMCCGKIWNSESLLLTMCGSQIGEAKLFKTICVVARYGAKIFLNKYALWQDMEL